jgi:hypothetical protein
MKIIPFLLLFLFTSVEAASTCSLAWDPVPKATGYRVYVDGVMTVDQFQWPLIKCETAGIVKDKEVTAYVTAVGARPGLESLPSNSLKVLWEDRLGAPIMFRITIGEE